MQLSDLAIVWGESVTNGPGGPPTVSVSNWSTVLDMPWQRWDTRQPGTMPEAVRKASVIIVNMFHTTDSRHIEQIKAVNPDCYCIACPDACVDIILTRPDWMHMLHQMSLADAIGGRTRADCKVYGELLNMDTFYLPSPIGPTEFFLPFRDLLKEDYILTLDHSIDVANNTANNVAAVAAIQRKLGCRVLYASQRDWTPDYARLAGLKAEFLGHVGWPHFVTITAKARMCIDIYTRHSYGRQQVLCAMVGTPIIGSAWCDDAPGEHIDPFDPVDASIMAELLSNENYYKTAIDEQYRMVEQFTFKRSRERVLSILEQVRVEA